VTERYWPVVVEQTQTFLVPIIAETQEEAVSIAEDRAFLYMLTLDDPVFDDRWSIYQPDKGTANALKGPIADIEALNDG
jgi:hypothetical protein